MVVVHITQVSTSLTGSLLPGPSLSPPRGEDSSRHLQDSAFLGTQPGKLFHVTPRDTSLATRFASELLNLPGLCRPEKSLHQQAGINIFERISPSPLPSTQEKPLSGKQGFASAADYGGGKLDDSVPNPLQALMHKKQQKETQPLHGFSRAARGHVII